MPIIFVCPECRHRVKVSRRYAGATRDCPACHGTVRVPEPELASGVEVSVAESSAELPLAAPLTLDDALFIEIARAIGFPEDWKLDHFVKLQEQRAREGKSWSLLRLMCANDALSTEQEEQLERIAALLATIPREGGAISVLEIVKKVLATGGSELGERERELRERAELMRRYAAPAPAPSSEALTNTLVQTRGPEAEEVAAVAPPASDTRECPRCAETIKVRAKICRFCGASFEEPPAPPPPAPPAPARRDETPRPPVARPLIARSSGRVAVAAPRGSRSAQLVFVLSVVAAVGAIAVAASIATRAPAPPPAAVVVEPPPASEETPPPPPAPRAAPLRPPPGRVAPGDDSADVEHVVREVQRLRAARFERQAAKLIESALESPHAPGGLDRLRAARDELYAECRRTVDAACADIEKAALGMDMVAARFMLADLADHVPDAVVAYEEERVEKINALLRAKWGEGLEGDPRDLERYRRARPELDAALAALDVAAARRVVDRLSGVNTSPRTIALLALDTVRIRAVTSLRGRARDGAAALVGSDVALELAVGASAKGRLSRVDGDELSLDLDKGGRRVVRFGELAAARLAELVSDGSDDARLGLAIVLACRGDKPGASTILASLKANADAAKVRADLQGAEQLAISKPH